MRGGRHTGHDRLRRRRGHTAVGGERVNTFAIREETTPLSLTFPGESKEYRVARNRLLEQEIELRRAMQAVAAARRELPPGGPVPENYVFEEAGEDGAPTEVLFSELFAPGKDSLVIYNFMFPRSYRALRSTRSSGSTSGSSRRRRWRGS
jgi:predicted dithiol-disulfide oxidoreductase (DUF899 family)